MQLLAYFPLFMKNDFLVLLKGNNYCTISDVSVQYKRVQDYQAASNERIIQKAKLTVWEKNESAEAVSNDIIGLKQVFFSTA